MFRLKRVIKYFQWMCGLASLIAIPLWYFYIAPDFKKMPDDFTYQADILSLDNFYDANLSQYIGEQISNTRFGYSVIGKNPDYLVIKNIFDVVKQSGETIIFVKRQYYIDPYTGAHVGGDRTGYLFGPRYAPKTGFNYWHVNYDKPAELKYLQKESINGLTVYHYQAIFTVDQTADLTQLQDVPKKYGISTDVILNIWIEPISGWLVKYNDNSTAWYVDALTKKRLHPWNKFSNRYTQSSVLKQVANATGLKYKILLIDFGVPILLVCFALSMLFWPNLKKSGSRIRIIKFDVLYRDVDRYIFLPLVGLVFLGFVTTITYFVFIQSRLQPSYTVGIATWSDNPEYEKAIKGFKDGLAEEGFQEGRNIKFIENNADDQLETQISIIHSFLNQKVDLIFTITTKGVLVAKGITTETPIVFSLVNYPVESNAIYSLSNSRNNLVGSRTYIPPAMQFHQLEKIYPNIKTVGFIHRKGDPNSEIQLQEFKKLFDKRNIVLVDISAVNEEDLASQLTNAIRQVDAVYLACDPWIQTKGGEKSLEITLKNKVPAFSCSKENVMKGALLGFVADNYDVAKMAGKEAAWILRGAEPSWLETKSPTRGYLILNPASAALLGVKIPSEVLKQADYIVQ